MSETQPWKFFALQRLNFQFLKLKFQFLEGNFKMSEPCVGDRDLGDGEQGSDGVVPYKSSHLEGSVSELIVPSDHAATAHPLTVLEVKRILHLHLQQAGLLSS